MKRTTLKANPETTRAFVERGHRSSARAMSRLRPVSPASPEQRARAKGAVCVNCGGSPCDPAHLTSRAQGGCDHPDCVIALCRGCHRRFDEGDLDLEAVLALPEFAAERSHMASHGSFQACIRRLRGARSE